MDHVNRLLRQLFINPICSMYGIFTYIWVIYVVNVGKYYTWSIWECFPSTHAQSWPSCESCTSKSLMPKRAAKEPWAYLMGLHWYFYQWIGLRENLHRKPSIFPLNTSFSCNLSLKPIHWFYLGISATYVDVPGTAICSNFSRSRVHILEPGPSFGRHALKGETVSTCLLILLGSLGYAGCLHWLLYCQMLPHNHHLDTEPYAVIIDLNCWISLQNPILLDQFGLTKYHRSHWTGQHREPKKSTAWFDCSYWLFLKKYYLVAIW
jgi:hypothetical protein